MSAVSPLYLLGVLVEEGEGPGPLPGRLPRGLNLRDEVLVVAHEARGVVAERDDAGAGQGGAVDTAEGS